MKSLFVSAFLLLGTVCASQAQVGTTKPLSNTDNPGPDFSATSAGKVTLPDSPAAADSFAEPRANSSFSAPRLGTALLDRKSTRLNSSHVAISYAVFCLKKKRT